MGQRLRGLHYGFRDSPVQKHPFLSKGWLSHPRRSGTDYTGHIVTRGVETALSRWDSTSDLRFFGGSKRFFSATCKFQANLATHSQALTFV